MIGKLTVMQGPSNPLKGIDPKMLSSLDAGLLLLGTAIQYYPNLQWSDLARGIKPSAMHGWLTNLGHDIASAARSTVGVITDAVNGSAQAVATIAPAIESGVADYSTGGISGAVSGVLSSIGSGASTDDATQAYLSPDQISAVSAVGSSYQAQSTGISSGMKWALIAGGGGLVLFLIMSNKK